jgi:type IV pilus assembly protein PilQ
MKVSGVFLKVGCVFILALFFFAVVSVTMTTATEPPGVLKDVRVFSQGGQWHVVLIGSQSMTYKATKTSNPLRVVVDLPNTASKPLIASPVGGNEIIETVKSSTVVHGPPPLTRVEIVLKKDISYDIRQEEEKIRISFDAVPPTSQAEGTEAEPAAEANDDISPTTTKESPTTVTSELSPEEPKRAAEQALPPASTILAIEPVEMGEDIDVHIIGDGRFDKYDVSLLSDPPRLVVDLFGVKSTGIKDELSLSGPWAKRLRIGRHAEKVRVVFDLLFAPKGEFPFQVTVEENRLVVSLLPGHSLPPQ